ncbi:MAG: tetratricopeptide repeat protein [Myxococcaceae bacterium]|nr:tetratricopeptide repeat protein [Myxococcaceae bacterium]
MKPTSPHPPDHQLAAVAEGTLAAESADAVREHLDVCAECRLVVAEVIREGSVVPVTGTLGGARPPERLPEPGTPLSRYVLLEQRGQGANGVVYAAHDPLLHRTVALKLRMPRAGESSRVHFERLLKEGRALARLHHPHVTAVYDVAEDQGWTFVAMQYVEGHTLRAWLALHPGSLSHRLALLRQAGEGLAAAHEAGLVHRDVKPDNILVEASGHAYVTDFGLAAPREGSEAGIAGTAGYVAPELFLGQPADARADQFSFCVTLSEVLHGVRPFAGTRLETYREALLRGERVKDTARLPRHVQQVIDRGLRMAPTERFPSMRALLEALAPRRPRWPRVLAVLGGVGLIGAGGLLLRPVAHCEGVTAELEPTWNPAVVARLDERFAHAPAFVAGSRGATLQALEAWTTSWKRTATHACAETYERRTRSESVYLRQLGCLEQQRLQLSALLDVLIEPEGLGRALEAVERLPAPDRCEGPRPLLSGGEVPADPRIARGRALCATGRCAEATPLLEAAHQELEKSGSPARRVDAALALAEARGRMEDNTRASASFLEALTTALELGEDAAASEAALGLLWIEGVHLRRFDEGERALRIGRALLLRSGGDEALSARIDRTAAEFRMVAGRYDEALKLAQQALAKQEKRSGATSLGAARARLSRGTIAWQMGRYDEALQDFEAAQRTLVERLGGEHPDIAQVSHNMAAVWLRRGEPAKAEPLMRRASEILRRARGPEHVATLSSELGLGAAVFMQGRLAEARAAFAHVLAGQEKAWGPDHPKLAAVLSNLGEVELASGAPERARPLLERSLALVARGDDGPYEAADTRFVLARVFAALHKPTQARRLAVEAREAWKQGGSGFSSRVEAVDTFLRTLR